MTHEAQYICIWTFVEKERVSLLDLKVRYCNMNIGLMTLYREMP